MKLMLHALLLVLLFSGSAFASGASPELPGEAPRLDTSIEQITGILTLERAIDIAMKNSPDLLAREAERKMAQAEKKKEESRLNPALSLTGRASTQNMPMIVASAPNVMPQSLFQVPGATVVDLSAMLMAPLYTGGSIQNSVLAKRFQEIAAEWEAERVRRALVMEIRISYLQVLYLDESLRTYDSHITHLEESLGRSRKLYDRGKIPGVYLLRAKNDLSSARIDINKLKAERQAVVSALLALMGVSPSSSVAIEGKLSPWEFQESREMLIGSLSLHPVLKGLEQERKRTEFELRAIQGEYVPQVYVYGMGRVIGTTVNSQPSEYGAGIVASIAVSDGGLRRAMTEETKARRDLVDARMKEAALGLEKDIVAQYEAMKSAQQNVELSEAAIKEAEEVLRIAKLRYEAGKGIHLEISDAFWNLVRQNLMRHEAVKEYNTSITRLKYVVGK